MPSIYALAQAYRRALLQRDEAARARLVASYNQVRGNLLTQLEQLTIQLEAAQREGKTLSPAFLYRQERYQSLLRQIKSEIQRWATFTVAPVVTAEQQQAISLGAQHAGSLIAAQSGDIAASFTRLSVGALEQLAGFTADGSPLSKRLNKYGSVTAQLVKNALTANLAAGKGIQQTASEITKLIDQPRWQAERLARTEILRAHREASRETYKANGIEQWQWLASKSKRTCAACLYLDGKVFSVEKPMPVHPNCRCTLTPVVPGFEPLQRTHGEQWFAQQSAETQAGILGRAGATAYRDGQVTLGDFVGVKKSRTWGESRYQQSLAGALKQAGRRPIQPATSQVFLPVPAAVLDDFGESVTWKAWRASLTTAEREAFRAYSDLQYLDVNDFLRGARQPYDPARVAALIPQLDAGLAKGRVNADILAFRGSNDQRLVQAVADGNLQVGKEWRDAGYFSTSLNPKKAEEFSDAKKPGAVFWHVRVPAGSRAVYLGHAETAVLPEEYELLLPRGSRLKILRIEQRSGRLEIEAELISD